MKNFLACLIISVVLFSDFGAAFAQNAAQTAPVVVQVEKPVQDKLDVLLGAIEEGSYADFISVGDDNFKAALTPETFQNVLAQIAPRIKLGYTLTYLGELKQRGFGVYLWKAVFKDKGDDGLVELSVKDDKVGGFFLR